MKFYINIMVACAVFAFIACCCGENEVNPALAGLLDPQRTSSPYDSRGVTAPDDSCMRLKVRPIGGSLARVFNDVNAEHLVYAKRDGITPITDIQSAWTQGKGLVELHSNENYFLDELTHSYPYLTRDAADLLNDICAAFQDSLTARGGGAYRPKVTSVLRTPLTVGHLRRVNRNATNESAHQYGTTFDISYAKFICDDSTGVRRTFEDLKNLLAEIVAGERQKGRCKVKFERRQGCLHITAISPAAGPAYDE